MVRDRQGWRKTVLQAKAQNGLQSLIRIRRNFPTNMPKILWTVLDINL